MNFKLLVGFLLIVFATIAYGFDWDEFDFDFDVSSKLGVKSGKKDIKFKLPKFKKGE